METSVKIILGLLISGLSFLGGNWVHTVDKRMGEIPQLRTDLALHEQAVRIYIGNQEHILAELKTLSIKIDTLQARVERRSLVTPKRNGNATGAYRVLPHIGSATREGASSSVGGRGGV